MLPIPEGGSPCDGAHMEFPQQAGLQSDKALHLLLLFQAHVH